MVELNGGWNERQREKAFHKSQAASASSKIGKRRRFSFLKTRIRCGT